MVQLLTNPGEFSGSEIQVRGYLGAPTLSLALFLTREHAEIGDHVSSIPVADHTPDGYLTLSCAGHHAIVDGTLRRQHDAPTIVGASGASLRYIIADVTRVLTYGDGGLETCWPREAGE